jgi:hypothetical protein
MPRSGLKKAFFLLGSIEELEEIYSTKIYTIVTPKISVGAHVRTEL